MQDMDRYPASLTHPALSPGPHLPITMEPLPEIEMDSEAEELGDGESIAD
jgi:hypothetical protein